MMDPEREDEEPPTPPVVLLFAFGFFSVVAPPAPKSAMEAAMPPLTPANFVFAGELAGFGVPSSPLRSLSRFVTTFAADEDALAAAGVSIMPTTPRLSSPTEL